MKSRKLDKGKKGVAVIIVFSLLFCLCGCAKDQKPVNVESGAPVEQAERETPAVQLPSPEPSLSPELISPEEIIEEPTLETEAAENLQTDPDALQIIFLGDSELDDNRNKTGIPYLVGKTCNAGVFNLSVANSSYALNSDEPYGNEEMNSNSLVAVSLMLADRVSTNAIQGTKAAEVMETFDISNTDYFVIMYGVNDYLRHVPLSGENIVDISTYVGALRVAVSALQDTVPQAKIVICSPHYAQFFEEDVYLGDGNILKNNIGATLYDYKGIAEYVAGEKDALFINAYQDLEIDSYSADEYLADGISLTEAGRELYADFLSQRILEYEETRNN